jgi:CRISPR-associated endonuclease/helicase Cas3
MAVPLLSSDLFSHPSVLLEDHLIGVSSLATLFLSEKPERIRNELSGLTRIVALSHDIGKATTYFQDYLRVANDEQKQRLRSKETSHSLLSAVCAYYLSKAVTNNTLYHLFAYISVRRHHGNLIDISDEVALFQEGDANLLYAQLDSIKKQRFAILAEKLATSDLGVLLCKEAIRGWISDFKNEMAKQKKLVRKLGHDLKNYIVLNLLYSLLIDADKSDVVVGNALAFERKSINARCWVDNYLSSAQLPSSPINGLRTRAYNEVAAHDINLDRKIYSLNLPTGLGKTLSALSFALRLKSKLEAEGTNPRIVYALPFLSVIDQNSKVFENVIRANNIDPNTSILLKHHHLSEILYEDGENEYEPDEAKILIEGWNSEIIVTTFAQFFFALISNRNRNIRKFHRLANAIIILDEVQTIPVKYWLLMKTLLMELTKTLNAYIVVSTATEPLLFGGGDTIHLADSEFYFSSLDRISLVSASTSPITIEELADKESPVEGKSYLYIFNTVGSTRKFYNLIKEFGLATTYLSTHIPPKERLNRIEGIKKGLYQVVVSTQLIEAGVDIDFDVVIRDFAPLDSINQSAGRCNRNGNRKGIVKAVALQDDKGKLYAHWVYDAVLLSATEKVLRDRREINETEFPKILDEYYSLVSERISQQQSSAIINAVERLKYDREPSDTADISISDFRLIDNDYPKMDVFIERDEQAVSVWANFCDLKNIKDRFARKRAFDSFKSDFYKYVISIPLNAPNRPPSVGELGYVSQDTLSDYYDTETGFILKDDRSVVIW